MMMMIINFEKYNYSLQRRFDSGSELETRQKNHLLIRRREEGKGHTHLKILKFFCFKILKKRWQKKENNTKKTV